MDRIQIALIALAGLLLVVSFMVQSPERPAPPEPPKTTEARPAAPERVEGAGAERPPPMTRHDEPRHEPLQSGRVIELSNDAIELRVNSMGARVESLKLLEFAARKGNNVDKVQLVTDTRRGTLFAFLGPEPLRGLERTNYEIGSHDARHVELRAERDGVEVVRGIRLDESGYGGQLRIAIRNRSSQPVAASLSVVFYAQEGPAGSPDRFLNYSLLASQNGDIERMPLAGISSPGFFSRLFGGGGEPTTKEFEAPIDLVGTDSQYFLLACVAENPRLAKGFFDPLGVDLGRSALSFPAEELPPGTALERRYRLYMGPKIRESVRAVDMRLDPALDVGWSWVRPLVDLFGGMLRWTHQNVVANYGVAIILLTILLRIAVYPLTQRSMKSMKKFSVIAPDMKALQEKYGDDRGKLQEQMMKLYRDKGINPLSAMGGGCIPILIQMPFMIALYFALQSSIELRHAPFALWIDDLSAPEDLFSIGPIPVRVLPLMMGATMVLQQRLTPNPSADAQQRQMMTMMSLMFIILFYAFPSGLVLYWFVSNLLGIAQQMWVNRAPAAS